MIAAAASLGSIGFSAEAAPFQTIVVQPIQVCATDGSSCAAVNLNAAVGNAIYGQADVGITYLAPKTLFASEYLTTDIVANNQNPIDEVRQLLRGSPLASLGLSANSSILNAFFVNELREVDLNGTLTGSGTGAVGFAFINGNGIVIDQGARIDTLPHEIGHNLGLDHGTFGAGAANNLMTSGSIRVSPASVADIAPNGQALDQLNAAQIAEARNPLFSVGLARVVAEQGAGADIARCRDFLNGFRCLQVNYDPSLPSATQLKSLQLRFLTDDFLNTGITGILDPHAGTTRLLTPEFSPLPGGGVNVKFTFAPGDFEFGDEFLIAERPLFGGSGNPLSFTFDFANGFSTQGSFDGISASSDRPLEITYDGDPLVPNFVPLSDLFEVDPAGPLAAVPEPSTALLLAGGLAWLVGRRRNERRATRT
jgi:filamentous hemagglutinin family protein